MGDRGNIALEGFHGDGGRIYLYTHWGGSGTPVTLANALDSARGRGRWNDDSYLTRIIADELFESIRGEETGGGIGLSRIGDEWPLLVVNLARQTVYLEEIEGEWARPYGVEGCAPKSFETYIAAVREAELREDVWTPVIEAYGGHDPYADDDAEDDS